MQIKPINALVNESDAVDKISQAAACSLRRCPMAGGRTWRRLAAAAGYSVMLLGGLQRPVHAQVSDTVAARVEACAACHGARGEGIDNDYFPRLAGKPVGYLFQELVAFRDGRRRYPPMNYLLEYQNDAFLQQIAVYFAAQHPPLRPQPRTNVSPAILQRGWVIATLGDASTGVPACAECHGPTFTGMLPAIPGLIGLHASYISAQLGEWRYGTRTAAAPDCMQVVAGHLTEADTTAVAAWLSTRPLPPEHAPVPRGSLTMPLPCGSAPH